MFKANASLWNGTSGPVSPVGMDAIVIIRHCSLLYNAYCRLTPTAQIITVVYLSTVCATLKPLLYRC
jgi:hypothetical protein